MKSLYRVLAFALCTLSVICAIPSKTYACSPAFQSTSIESIEAAEAIFVGKITSIEPNSLGGTAQVTFDVSTVLKGSVIEPNSLDGTAQVTFDVSRVLKGSVLRTQTLRMPIGSKLCGPSNITVGAQLVVYATFDPLSNPSLCGPNPLYADSLTGTHAAPSTRTERRILGQGVRPSR